MYQGDRPNSSPTAKATRKNALASRGISRLLDANIKRVGATIVNHANRTLYLDFDATVSDSDYWIALPPAALYEMPYRTGEELYGTWVSDEIVEGKALIRDFIED